MKKSILTLLSGACLLCSCGAGTINAEKLGSYVDDLYITNHSSSFEVPDAMSIYSEVSLEYTYEGNDDSETAEEINNTTSTSLSVVEYNFTTGYFHVLSNVETNGEKQIVEIYSYADGKDLYTVGTMSGMNRYSVATYASEDIALQNAIDYLNSQGVKDKDEENEAYYYSAGCDVLDIISNYVEIINGSDDSDLTEGYDKFEVKLVSANEKNENTFSGEFKTIASESAELEGIATSTSYDETIKFSFEDGLLTSLIQSYLIVISSKTGEAAAESLTENIASTTTIKYSFTETYPDLTKYEKVDL